MPSRLFPWRVLILIALLLTVVPKASAEPIQWSYQGQITTTGPSNISPPWDNGSSNPHILVAAEVTPSGFVMRDYDNWVQFADGAGSGAGSATMTAFQMRANTDFGSLEPFSANLHTFTLGFGILDKASGQSSTVTFQGWLDGRMTSETTNSFVNLQVGFTGALQKSMVLGDHLYKVSVDPYRFIYSQDVNTVFKFPFVTPYQNVSFNVQVSDVPEPSTLALAALGLSGLGLRAWRRRRRLPMSLA
jgi:hypothetical protein